MSSTASPQRSSGLLAVAVGMMVLAALVPYGLGALAPQVTRGLQISDAQFGLVVGAVYLVAAVAAGALGSWVDRVGLRRLTVLSFVACAMSFAGLSISRGLWDALGWALLGGFVLAVSNPITNLVVVRGFRPESWASVIGWKQSGVPIAALISGAVLGPLGSASGWRASLALAALAPLVLVIVAARALPSGRVAEVSSGPARVQGTVKLGPLVAFALVMGIGNGIITSYYVLYTQAATGASATQAGMIMTVVGVAGTATRVLAVRWFGGVPYYRVLTGLAVVSVASSSCVLLVAHAGLWLMVVAAVLAGAGALGWLAFAMLALAERVPRAELGRTSGVISQVFYVGLMSGPPLGALVLSLSSYTGVWLAQACLYVIGAIVMAHCWRREERRHARS